MPRNGSPLTLTKPIQVADSQRPVRGCVDKTMDSGGLVVHYFSYLTPHDTLALATTTYLVLKLELGMPFWLPSMNINLEMDPHSELSI